MSTNSFFVAPSRAPGEPALGRLGMAVLRGLTAIALASILAVALATGPASAKGAFTDPSVNAAAANPEVVVLHVGKAKVLNLPREARDVLVSDPKIVDTVLRTATQPVLFGMRIGQANVLFFDGQNREIRSIEIRVEHDVAMLNRMIRDQHPTSRVHAESVFGDIVLTGQTASSAEAQSIVEVSKRFVAAARSAQSDTGQAIEVTAESDGGVINRISILNEEQIHLQVRVAEVSRNVLKQLGVDWNAGLQSTSLSSTVGVRSGGLASFLDASPTSLTVGPQTLDSFLKALEQYTFVRTLASPSLTAVSGEKASFLAGGEFPIPVARTDNEITIEFKKFGVGLDFTPVSLGAGRISMEIATEVSDLSDENSITISGTTIPALSVRRADTTVEVSSGGTIMIAGLIKQSTRRLSAGLPGLRSLPVLGAFFRSEEHEIDETELVVLVTPYEVRPGAPEDYKIPTDGFAPASDLDVYLFGRLHAVYGAESKPEAQIRAETSGLTAPVGYMME